MSKTSDESVGRRDVLTAAAAGLAAGRLGSILGPTEAAAEENRRLRRRGRRRPRLSPPLAALYYPTSQSPAQPFPEQAYPRFAAASGQWGVSFSGGGPRAFAAALGQMRGLFAAGALPHIGAISSVSGGTWFNAPFCFAPAAYSDAALLGPVVPPSAITLAGLASLAAPNLGAALSRLTNVQIGLLAALYIGEYQLGYLPFDKVWSRILNDCLLAPYGLDDDATSVTLNAATLAAIQGRNPGLAAPFYLPRAGRPFLIAGATQIYPTGSASPRFVRRAGLAGQIYRGFEYTPLYVGTPQLFPGTGPGGVDFGGGFVESFAFDTPAPSGTSAGNVAHVAAAAYPFLLSDAIGSSSAAVASVIDALTQYSAGFPQFSAWPMVNIGGESAATYSFGDGGVLENTGIVALLRRRYPVIFAFVNTSFPVNSTDPSCVSGIDGQITRLFGLIPSNNDGNTQNTQVFSTAQFAGLAAGLKAARNAGQAVVQASAYPVMPGNTFGIPAYTPQIFWVYNDMNMSWFNKVPVPVQSLLQSTNPSNYLGRVDKAHKGDSPTRRSMIRS